jgi:hypothetical protein
MKPNLLLAALVSLSIAAAGCGSSGSESIGTSEGAVELDESQPETVQIVGLMRGASQRDFLLKSIRPSTWLKARIIRDLDLDLDGFIPRGIKLQLASGEWSEQPVHLSLEFDKSKHEKDRRFRITGTSSRIDLDLTFTVEDVEEGLKLTIDSTAKVKGSPAASKALANAARGLLSAFEAELLDNSR